MLDCLIGGVVCALTWEAYNLNVAGSNPVTPTSRECSTAVVRQLFRASRTCADDFFAELIMGAMPCALTAVAYNRVFKHPYWLIPSCPERDSN